MARMGDKVQAKAELKRAGVPLVPGATKASTSSSRGTLGGSGRSAIRCC